MTDQPANGTVLVVEDEAIVRMLGTDTLEEAGFRVLEAASADEAVKVLETAPDVQVLFSDVRMPGSMDGVDLARLVHQRWPGIGILLTSGHMVAGDMALPDDGRFMPKPYRLTAMVDAIQALLRDKHGAA